jgi:uncharacterized membrane protein YczE
MNKLLLRTLLSIIFYIQFSLGAALTVIAGVGVASVNAFALTVSDLTLIKVGTLLAAFNIGFSILYAILTKFKYITLGIIQMIAFIAFGYILNFLVYDVFQQYAFPNYVFRLLSLTLGIIMAGSAIGIVTFLRVVTFPVEMVCHHLETLGIMSFMKARYSLDIILIILALLFSFIFQTDIYLREGTIITVLFFSFVMSRSNKFVEKRFINTLF